MVGAGIDSAELLRFLAADVALLREAASADLSAPVPSCPGWTLADLLRHLAHGYMNVVVPQLRQTEPTPTSELADSDPMAAFEHGYAVMLEELAASESRENADRRLATFWIRRMAHETAMHRIDADLVMRRPSTPIPTELAVDGVDELLTVFLARETTQWPEQYAAELSDWAPRWLMVSCGGAAWHVRVRPQGVEVTPLDPRQPQEAGCAARIDCDAETFLRWAYNRPMTQQVAISGDRPMVEQFKRLLTAVTSVS
jgi:uncharacterized protein (TIGR03083 family)